MTTDNRTNEPTPEQVEAAAEGMWDRYGDRGMFQHAAEHMKNAFRKDARAALVAAQGAAPQDNGKCGGCRDLGPHRNVPGCQYYEAPVLPSSGVDEETLANLIHSTSVAHFGGLDPRVAPIIARAVAEWLKGQGNAARE